MRIQFDHQQQVFHLQTQTTSYVIQIKEEGYISHVYWGKRLELFDISNEILYRDRGFSANPIYGRREFSLDTLPQEYPQFGNGDFRDCAYQIEDEQGCRISDLRYKTHHIYEGKQPLHKLPYLYEDEEGEVSTLEIVMKDTLYNFEVILQYNVFEKKNVITRSVRFHNYETTSITLLRALSMNVDIRRDDLDVISLYGSHNNEANYERHPLLHKRCVIESKRGASSPHHSPFMALAQQHTTQDHGEVYAFHFMYSGNFIMNVDCDVLHTTRASVGIHPFEFSWKLSSNESFQTPEVIMVYSCHGLQEMSKTFHEVYKNNVCRGRFKHEPRPILINNWEATYFDFNEEKLINLAKAAASTGVELFVLDDGWFKGRNSDTTSLGDWVCDTKKLPHGLSYLADQVTTLGMQFGLWFEPEMVSVDSDCYRNHPEYCIHAPNRAHTFGRDQLVLDLTKEEVRSFILESMYNILDSADIRYVKWDMNRHLCDMYAYELDATQQKEFHHRYILGLYDIMDQLVNRYPSILFESCSSGGGRFDPGMLYYMPQTWTSDNTDALCRSQIQYNTSHIFPLITMGSHVSSCPNDQVGRTTPLTTRANVAMFGNLGYELDMTKCTTEELNCIREQIKQYKRIRNYIQFGTLYHISNTLSNGYMAMNVVSKTEEDILCLYVKGLSQASGAYDIVLLKGLQEDVVYEDIYTKKRFYGSQLMYAGISIPYVAKDFYSCILHFRKVDV